MNWKNLTAALVLTLVACGGPLKYMPKATTRAPGTEVLVTADVKKEQNSTQLNVKMVHLPPPNSIQEGTKNFVVWQRKGADAHWTRIGGLVYKESDREGMLENATVPEVGFEMMITAEEKPDATAPSAHVVVEQKVNL
jgi:predicted small lipoprotein YifL